MDIDLPGGGRLHGYDTAEPDARLVVLWHHGTPNIGTPPGPLLPASARAGIRWISYDRPGYGGSTDDPDRTTGSAAGYAAAVADHLGVDRFAVMGHSGGGSFALATAALLPDRVVAAVSVAGLAPYDADGLDWYAGMGPSGVASLTAATRGRRAKEAHEAAADDAEPDFTAADLAAFDGPWGWFGSVVGPALARGPGGLVTDDLGYVAQWGADPADVRAPTLLVHGDEDRVVPVGHAEWLARAITGAELRRYPGESHISVLAAGGEDAISWLAAQAG